LRIRRVVADPGFLVPVGIALDTDIAVPGKIGQHRGQCHAQLALDPARRLGGTELSLAWTAALAFGLRGRHRLIRFHRFLAGLDRRAVA